MNNSVANGSGESKAERIPFWKFYTDDWIGGTVGFTCEQEGFYHRVLVRMWARQDGLPNDVKWLSGALCCDPRTVRRLLEFLIGEGKLKVRDGMLINERMMREIGAHKTRTTSGRDRPKIGRRSLGDWAKIEANKSEKPAISTKEALVENHPDPDPDPDKKSRPSKEGLGADAPQPPPAELDALKAFQAYNALALRLGLPQAAYLTDARRKSIKARLRECGGEAGWQRALEHVERSAFLQGRNDRGWTASLDFVIQAKSFTKLLEGGYGNGAHAGLQPTKSRTMQAFEARLARQQEAANG
jgi:uncharacterized protein YdaU (DUF1376 family)